MFKRVERKIKRWHRLNDQGFQTFETFKTYRNFKDSRLEIFLGKLRIASKLTLKRTSLAISWASYQAKNSSSTIPFGIFAPYTSCQGATTLSFCPWSFFVPILSPVLSDTCVPRIDQKIPRFRVIWRNDIGTKLILTLMFSVASPFYVRSNLLSELQRLQKVFVRRCAYLNIYVIR